MSTISVKELLTFLMDKLKKEFIALYKYTGLLPRHNSQ
jgi:hypothetical protein